METAPRNCRFLSLVVVERVLSFVGDSPVVFRALWGCLVECLVIAKENRPSNPGPYDLVSLAIQRPAPCTYS